MTGPIYRPEGCVEIKGMHGLRADWSEVQIIDEDLAKGPLFRFEPGKFKKDLELQHGYVFPSPIILKRKLSLGESDIPALRKFYKPSALVALMRDLAIEATKRGIDVSTTHAYDAAYQELHRKKHVTFTLLDTYKYDLDRDLEEGYLLARLQAGGYHGESRILVGLALSHLLMCLATKEIALTWWERETHVMDTGRLEQWFGEIVAEFGESFPDLNDAILSYMKRAQDVCDQVEREAKDPTIHLYQDPGMETFWIERGDIRKAKELIAGNRHANSHKHLLPTLNAQAVEDAIVKQVIWYLTNATDWHLRGPLRELTSVSALLVTRWYMAVAEGNDEEEQQVLLKLANGLLRERLREAFQQMGPASKDRPSLMDYLDRQLDGDMDLFLKNRGMDITLKPEHAYPAAPEDWKGTDLGDDSDA